MGPIVRIALRYLAGALVARGLLPPDVARELASDPDLMGLVMQGADWLVVALGAGLAVAVEWAYGLAKRYGWAT